MSSAHTDAYGASKAGILSMTRTASREWGKANIRVNAICPGFIYPTGMTLMGEGKFPEAVKSASSKSALNRPGHPDEVAAVAAFLASDEARQSTTYPQDTMLPQERFARSAARWSLFLTLSNCLQTFRKHPP